MALPGLGLDTVLSSAETFDDVELLFLVEELGLGWVVWHDPEEQS